MTYILFNPHANAGNGTAGVERVRAAHAADRPEMLDLTAIDARAFLNGLTGEDRVILCGGDGTINRLVNDLGGVCPEAPVYVWRFGTGNDFLRDVTADSDRHAQAVLLNEHLKNIPYSIVDGKRYWFLNGCSAGVDALVCAKMDEERDKKPSYVKTAIRSFFKDYRTTTARVTVDGETREYDDVWMAGAMNGRYQGGGMKFAPDQDRKSELLCCFLWHGTKPFSTLLHFPSIMVGAQGRYTQHWEARFGKEITIEFGDPQYLQLDGETLAGVTKFTVKK